LNLGIIYSPKYVFTARHP